MARERTAERQSGLDALRILSALLITAIHYIGYSNVLENAEGGNRIWVVAVYSLTRIAVGEYILTMGYFMSEKKPTLKKMVFLDSKVMFYSIVVATGCVLFGLNSISLADGIRTMFPLLTDSYWFFTAYILVYLLSPLLNEIVIRCSRKRLKALLCFAWFVITIYFKLNPFTTGNNYMSGAHGIVWLSFLYITGAALRKYPDCLPKKKCCVAALISYSMIFAAYWIGIDFPKTVSFYEDCSLFPSILTICFFVIFRDLSFNSAKEKLTSYLASLSLGVYLVQEQCLLREPYWSYFNADMMMHSLWMPLQFIFAMALPWIIAIVIEKAFSIYWSTVGTSVFNGIEFRIRKWRGTVCEGK